MEFVMKEAMAVKDQMQSHQNLLLEAETSTFVDSSSAGPGQYNTMVGFDDILIQVLDTLTGQESSRQVISITGMGGMGKSTLAKHVYQHQLIVEHFDFRVWVTVSQHYKITKILMKLLEGYCEGNLSQVDEYELGYILHKVLTRRRFLIIIDDIWNIEAWDRLRCYLPDNNNGSRIMITTRLLNLARQIDDSHNVEMPLLDGDNSWKLFCKHVFREEDCPLELQGIGKKIVEGCKGLPLSISVVGGLLAKSQRTRQYWVHVTENLNSIVNLENDKYCLQILYMSYYNLPVHLKPYFLFMGVNFVNNEDFYPIYLLVGFFIAEGFVKPIRGRSLEEAAIECIIELVERNLILIHKTGELKDWMYKDCSMHDLLADLCLKESHKQNFIYIVGERSVSDIPRNINSMRRICVAENTSQVEVLPFLESAPLLRSLWCLSTDSLSLSSIRSRLLRVAVINEISYPKDYYG